MDKKFFALYLLPPRPDFALTMSNEERGIMMKHVEYWTDLMNKGKVVVFGPVMDPKEIYGLGVVKVDTDSELKSLIDNDPANGLNQYEFFPMRAVVPA